MHVGVYEWWIGMMTEAVIASPAEYYVNRSTVKLES
jgi:hypothetical protein